MQPVSNQIILLHLWTHKKYCYFSKFYKEKLLKSEIRAKKTVYAYVSRDWRETLRWVNFKNVVRKDSNCQPRQIFVTLFFGHANK
jgi:hypothetical protein